MEANVLATGLLYFGGAGPTACYFTLYNISTMPSSSTFEVSPFHPVVYFVTSTLSMSNTLLFLSTPKEVKRDV